ncbi:MAG: lysoplasmalogenase family protein [Bacillota bacterium]|nr:lysoplasmalogenase family protein [Bacillota bacterium]
MSDIQRLIIGVYFTLTMFYVVSVNLFPGDVLVRLTGWVTVLTIFIAALSIEKKCLEQKVLTVAAFFMVIGDFFLGLGERIGILKSWDVPLGMFGFMISYIFLIIAFQKNFSIKGKNLWAILPIAVVFITIFFNLAEFVKGPMFVAALVFGLVLCYMCWTALCSLFRGYFSKKAAWLIAISGCLIFISDMGVAHAVFNPLFKGQFVPWLKVYIWITFVPAWTLILATVTEENLKVQ